MASKTKVSIDAFVSAPFTHGWLSGRSRRVEEPPARLDGSAAPAYRAAALRLISLLLAAFMLACALWSLHQGREQLALVEAVILLPLLGNAWQLLWHNRPLLSPLALVCLALVALAMSIYYGQLTNIYWAPALIITFHFLLDRWLATALNGLFLIFLAPVVLEVLAPAHATMFMLNLALVSVTTYIFSRVVCRQDLNLQRVAVLDPLTQAYNRRYLMQCLDHTLELNRRYGKSASLIILDIDHFKAINDEHGHGAGDRVLRDLVHLIQQRLRRTDVLFRFGGEEFVILLNETSADCALQLARDCCQLTRDAPLLPGRAVTVSCGLAEILPGENPLGWLARCDEALYHAKHSGRDRAEVAA